MLNHGLSVGGDVRVAHRVRVALDFEQGVDISRLRLAQQELARSRGGEAWHPRYRAA
jgi:hypothetical protein